MSDYRPDSELMRLCAAPAGTPVPLSPDLYDILRLSQQLCEASDGTFDITIGPAVALWRRARQTHQLPTTDELAAARALTGPTLLTLNATTSPPTATLAKPGMKLDLGGIGKGYAAQAAVDLLRARGHPRCLVALSGDIALGDPPPDKPGWTLDLPLTPSPSHPLTLSRCAISTSGATEQYVEINGRRYAHILDPRTGLGLTECRTATVIAPRGEISDGLDTLACLLPPEQFQAVLARFPGACLVTAADLSAESAPNHPDHLPRRGPGPIAR
jgi:thiamine biosynthesis lipoprotein